MAVTGALAGPDARTDLEATEDGARVTDIAALVAAPDENDLELEDENDRLPENDPAISPLHDSSSKSRHLISRLSRWCFLSAQTKTSH